jgi:hypothetical protein
VYTGEIFKLNPGFPNLPFVTLDDSRFASDFLQLLVKVEIEKTSKAVDIKFLFIMLI